MPDYTNYSIVSWTDTTPITSVRLNQMSVNIDQVKIVNDDKPKGILKLATRGNNVSNVSGEIFANTKIIALTQETIGNVAYDNRVTVDSSRYYRLVLNLPGIEHSGPGGEDSAYYLRFRTGNTVGTGDIVAAFLLKPVPSLFINTAGGVVSSVSVNAAAGGTVSIVSNVSSQASTVFGAGKYEAAFRPTSANNQSYFAEIQRVAGSSGSNNASGWTVLASSGLFQFYIEDAGGFA